MRYLILRVILPALISLAPAVAAAQSVARVVETPEEALAEDGAAYARRHDVAPEEAVRRLCAQEETVAATERLRAEFAKRLAGISIENSPAYRIVVLLTGS